MDNSNSDQINKVEAKLSELEAKLDQKTNLIDEIKQDVDQLQVAERLHKRLETNLDKLVNKLEVVVRSQSENSVSSAISEEVKSQINTMQQFCISRFDHLQQFIHYKVEENTSQLRAEFNWLKDQVKQIKEEQELINTKIEKLCVNFEEMNTIPSKEGYIWVINGMEGKIKWPTMTEWSPNIKLHGYQFGAQAVMQTKNNDVYVYVSLKDIGHFRAFAKLGHLPRLSVSLCDINVNDDANDIVKICDPSFGNAKYQYNTTYYSVLLCQKSDILTPKYIFNDSVTVKIAISPPDQLEKPFSSNGTLLWTVDNYQRRRKMEEDRLVAGQLSPHFYTSDKGYRVKAEVELRYGTVKVRIYFISGEFDADLTSAFSHNTTVTLVDQSPTWLTRNDRTVSVRKSNIQDKSYKVNLSLKSDLNDFRDNYLKDDSLIIRIEIQPSVPS